MPGDDVVVGDGDAEGGVADHQGPEGEREIGQVDRRAEGDPGDDSGEGDREHDEQREGLPSEEA